MNLRNRGLSLILTLVMVFSLLPFPAPAKAAEPVKKTGTFYYASQEMQDYPATYYYDDGYFSPSSYTYQDSLATMSMCLAMSSANSYRTTDDAEGYKLKSQNLRNLLAECGFPDEHFTVSEGYVTKPTEDSIGIGASHKTITVNGQDYTLIAVAVRGGGYEIEWASNFTLGESGDHQGFAEARDQVLAFLTEYVTSQKITGSVKLWITGFSRGAITANMTAAALDAGYALGSSIQLAPADIYAYCFECPQGTVDTNAKNELYHNIFNIINPADMIAKVAPTQPSQFGFGRYGADLFLPTALTEGENYGHLKAAMLEKFNALPSTIDGYVVDDFQMKEVSVDDLFNDGIIVDNDDPRWDQNAFLNEVVYKLFDDIIQTRGKYVATYQEDFRNMSRLLFRSEKQMKIFGEKLGEKLEDQIAAIAVCLVLDLEDELTSIVQDAVMDALDEAGITDYSSEEVDKFTEMLVDLLLDFGRRYPDLTITAISNMESIVGAHYPEVCLAWLQSFDPNYMPAGTAGIDRIYGENRYQTAFAAADALKENRKAETFDTVVVASGTSFADALAGSYLANQKNAPVLLVNKHTVADVTAYITQNLSTNGMVYLLGGEAAVPAEMEAALNGYHVTRLAGANRYETNLQILTEAGTAEQEILICTGKSFADSLSASAVNRPILLVNQKLTDAQREFLAASSGKFIIIGGESAVSAELESQLQTYGTVERLGGTNRYETSVLVAQRFFQDPKSAVLAYAKKFPDGLCGGPLACGLNAPLILTADNNDTAAAAYAKQNGITNGIVLGGDSLISDQTAATILGQ